jgi:restriction endonuclease S subunit
MTGAAGQKRVPADFVANYLVPIPLLSEQSAISAYLDRATAVIDTAIDSARRQVELMREYRASLIAHVVTGKLDVRAAAEQLPQEAREPAVS